MINLRVNEQNTEWMSAWQSGGWIGMTLWKFVCQSLDEPLI